MVIHFDTSHTISDRQRKQNVLLSSQDEIRWGRSGLPEQCICILSSGVRQSVRHKPVYCVELIFLSSDSTSFLLL